MNAVRVALVGLSVFLIAGPGVRAAKPTYLEDPIAGHIKIGIGGHYRAGCWTSVRIDSPELSVSLPDADGIEVDCLGIDLPQGVDVFDGTYWGQIGRSAGQLKVIRNAEPIIGSLSSARGARRREGPLARAVPADNLWFVGVGRRDRWPLWNVDQTQAGDVTLSHLSHIDELWLDARGLSGVDTLVMHLPEINQENYSDDKIGAIIPWVHFGGRLVVFLGAKAVEDLNKNPSGVDREQITRLFVPVRITETIALPRFDALESYSGTSHRIVSAGRRNDTGLHVPRLDEVRGRVELSEAGIPLIVRSKCGFGEITFVALTLDEEPVSSWPGRQAFVNRVLGIAPATQPRGDEHLSHRFGLSDLSGQLCGALDCYSSVGEFSFWKLVALVVALALIVGPADYWLVYRLLRRPALTWLTLPAMLGVATWCVVAINASRDKPAIVASQVDLLDFDLASNIQRSNSWMGLYSKRSQRLDVSVSPNAILGIEPLDTRVGWFAAPGVGWTGMHSRTEGAMWAGISYENHAHQLTQVPFEAHGTRAFHSRWGWEYEVSSLVDGKLRVGVDGILLGSLTNKNLRLHNAVLLHDRWAWEIGDLAPGQTFTVPPAGHKDIGATLRETRTVSSAERGSHWQAALEYDATSRELAPVMRAMMFHEAIGGRHYTGLPNVQQAWLDMSHLLKDRAILFAELDEDFSACDWKVSDSKTPNEKQTIKPARRVSFVRVVLPLEAPSPAPVGGAP
ncbi:MAG: hypothetical protein JSS27_18790 [Planctomycetes bacterium]|nr:hypothetical protein [Planctomycetota bacterium]